jgi:cytochrome P450
VLLTLFYLRIAGSDTTSISVSYFLWEMSHRPDITAKLQAELGEAMPNAHIIPNISVLQSLPYFHALVKEGL